MTALGLAALGVASFGISFVVTLGLLRLIRPRPHETPPSLRQIEEHAYFQGWNDATTGRPYRETLR